MQGYIIICVSDESFDKIYPYYGNHYLRYYLLQVTSFIVA